MPDKMPRKSAQCRKCTRMIVLVNGRWESQAHGRENATKCMQDGGKHEPR